MSPKRGYELSERAFYGREEERKEKTSPTEGC